MGVSGEDGKVRTQRRNGSSDGRKSIKREVRRDVHGSFLLFTRTEGAAALTGVCIGPRTCYVAAGAVSRLRPYTTPQPVSSNDVFVLRQNLIVRSDIYRNELISLFVYS